MSFRLDDIIIDRIQMAVAEDFSGKLLYTLTQLADATINITAESKDAVDAQGTLIKRFYQGKQGEFTANNAMLNLNIVGAASGEGKQIATAESKITMPRIITVKAGESVELKEYEEGTIEVNALSNNGAMGERFEKDATASATAFSVVDGMFTPPTADGVEQYVVKYERSCAEGIAIVNKADKFPGTVRLTLKALCVDPCSADTLRACYIVLPSFQVSPEVEISLTTDAQLSYTGALQVDYCSSNKALYEIYICADDEE